MRLRDNVAIVTGGAHGMGEAKVAAVPEDLIERVTEILVSHPSLSWDETLQLVEEAEQ
jgi:hypothetical protein